MKKHPIFTACISVTLVALLSAPASYITSAPQRTDRGQGDLNRDDPCTHLPDPPGKAKGIDKQCPEAGSSSGVAKGDFNGDGFADLAIGEPGATISNHSSAGDVIILNGGSNGLTTTGRQLFYLSRIPAVQTVVGAKFGIQVVSESGDLFGSALASGDFNGDGFSDLVIGIPGKTVMNINDFPFCCSAHQGAGAVVIIYGSINGLTTDDPAVPAPLALTLNDGGEFRNTFAFDGAAFGQSLAWGNFNGDKNGDHDIGDLAIGAPFANVQIVGIPVVPLAGAVLVFTGNKTSGLGCGSRACAGHSGNARLLTTFGSLELNDSILDLFGQALTSGDFNGDGFSDLAIGVPGFSVTDTRHIGLVGVISGSAAGLDPFGSPAHQFFTADDFGAREAEGDRFGEALAAGDFNGDGKTDLAIGAPGKDVVLAAAGVAFVLFGGNSGLTSSGNQRWDQDTLGRVGQRSAQFGSALAAGDFNADGKTDLAIGVPFRDVGAAQVAGEVDVIYGSSNGLSMTAVRPPQFWTQNNALGAGNAQGGNQFGASLTAWNFGRNESRQICFPVVGCVFVPALPADLAIGVPFQRVNGVSGAGAVDVLYGSSLSNGLINTNRQVFNADNTNIGGPLSGAHFGAALY